MGRMARWRAATLALKSRTSIPHLEAQSVQSYKAIERFAIAQCFYARLTCAYCARAVQLSARDKASTRECPHSSHRVLTGS
ncbi:hypothetical protein BN2476_500065 [Paraburkholderia piptadeniae]|uniref:Uncharacterized protein n=1 Tax=Paraburkholderia piptadeniae TaxID=1701573 RepID=A0A1N7SFM5_9BURK|nr:hypothetical protein BN2476_500065 [Paraburkholderia piptadeniae]